MTKLLKTLAVSSLAICAILLISLMPNSPFMFISLVHGADSLGNDIRFIEVYQDAGAGYVLLLNTTTSNASIRIIGNQNIKFQIGIKLNNTLAVDETEAISFTKILMNITKAGSPVWTNKELTNVSCDEIGDYYEILESEEWTSDIPQDGEIFVCTILYQAYY